MFLDANEAYESREAVISQLSKRMLDERTDERRLIAADLHDEVLQPLFQMTLLAQVLKADISTGRLLELDEDLPQLLSAAETTADSLRALIGDLRRSAMGRGGVSPAIESLLRGLSQQFPSRIRSNIQQVELAPVAELVVYQIAKEAITNSVAHSKADTIDVSLQQMEEGILLEIEDNGDGFDPFIERVGHFGIAIMRERAAAIGAQLFIDAAPGAGCVVRLLVLAPSPEILDPGT